MVRNNARKYMFPFMNLYFKKRLEITHKKEVVTRNTSIPPKKLLLQGNQASITDLTIMDTFLALFTILH